MPLLFTAADLTAFTASPERAILPRGRRNGTVETAPACCSEE